MPAPPADRRLRLLRQALAELEHAADEYDLARPGLGARFLAVEKSIDSIHAAPHRWPRVDDRHHRVLVHRFPFAVFYRSHDAEVIIVASPTGGAGPATGRGADRSARALSV